MKILTNFLGVLAGLNIYVYGLGVSLTLLLFLFLFWQNIRKTSYSEEKLVDALFVSGVVGLLLGRVGFILMYSEMFKEGFLTWLNLITYPGVSAFFLWVGFFIFWLSYGWRRKYPFKSLVKLLVGPIVVSQLTLSVLSLLLAVGLTEIVTLGLYLFLIGLYLLLTRGFKKTQFKESYLVNLGLYLALPPLLVDFIKPERLYFLEQKFVSLEQLPYIAFILFLIISGLITLIKRKK